MASEPASNAFGNLRSGHPQPACPCTVRFMNLAGTPLKVKWVTFKGELKQYASIAHGAQHKQATHKTHAWILEDESGVVFAIYVGTGADVTVKIHGRDHFTISRATHTQDTPPLDNVQRSICEQLRQSHVSGKPRQPYHVYGAAIQQSQQPANIGDISKPPKKDKKDKKEKKEKKKHSFGFLHRESSSSDSSDDESKHGGHAWACNICQKKLKTTNDVWALRCGHMFHAECLDSSCQTRLWCPTCGAQITGVDDVCKLHPVQQGKESDAAEAAQANEQPSAAPVHEVLV